MAISVGYRVSLCTGLSADGTEESVPAMGAELSHVVSPV